MDTPSQHPPEASNNLALSECQTQLKQQQQELTGLLYAISHDLRAPLRAIAGFSEALREHAQGMLDSTGEHYLQRIEDSTKRMSVLLDALLSLSRIAQADMTYLDVDLGKLAEEAVRQVAGQYAQHHPAVVIAPDMHVQADVHLLKQALRCLLDNAWKCTANKPDARIEVGQTHVDQQTIYYVRDNGVGFDMNYAAKLFVPFQKLHARTELNGVGIGLATAQRIITRHGGRLWAEAQPEAGAQFFFTLPSQT